jgi:hypothetical protein
LLYHYDPTQAGPSEGEVSEWLAFHKAVRDAGAFVYEAGFQPATTARIMSVRDGSATTTEGPVVTTGDVIASLYAIDVADADAAQDWAQRIPTARYNRVEMRPIVGVPG